MRKRKRNTLAAISAALQCGTLQEIKGAVAEVKPLPKLSQKETVHQVRGKQKIRGYSKIPTGWGNRNAHFGV